MTVNVVTKPPFDKDTICNGGQVFYCLTINIIVQNDIIVLKHHWECNYESFLPTL